MITLILMIVLVIFIVACFFVGAIWFLAVVGIVFLFKARKWHWKYTTSCTFKPTPVGCPSCGSKNIQVETIMTGSRTSAYTYPGGLLEGVTRARTTNEYEKRGYCKDCGDDYLIVTSDMIKGLKTAFLKRYKLDLFWGIILTSIGGLGILYIAITAVSH